MFDLLMDGSELVQRLHGSTKYFRTAMKEAGFHLKVCVCMCGNLTSLVNPMCVCVCQGDDHPIVPVMLGDARLAAEIADEMLERGIYVIGFSYPVVPKGEAFLPQLSLKRLCAILPLLVC